MYLDLMQLEDELDGLLHDFGYQVVDLQSAGYRGRSTFRLFIDRVDGEPVGIDDCASISGPVRLFLEKKGVYNQDSSLEVSSGGLDRVLKRSRDLERYLGSEVDVTSHDGQHRRTLRGELSSFNDDELVLTTIVAGGERSAQRILRSQVTQTRLVPHVEI